MLQHTFCHLPGIGRAAEQKLWRAGFTTWHTLMASSKATGKPRLHEDCWPALDESIDRYARRDLAYFASCLVSRDRWRLYHEGRNSCVFLDIETTGLDLYAEITTVTLYDGRQLRCFVAGRDLDELPSWLARYNLLITYNGASFDLPVLQRCLGIRLAQAHIDLRHVLGSLGLRGGLKGCERQLGIVRPGLQELNGYFAVLLWRNYLQTRNVRALETLLAYNVQDTINLEVLMVVAHNRQLEGTALAHLQLPQPELPDNPYTPDAETIGQIANAPFARWGN